MGSARSSRVGSVGRNAQLHFGSCFWLAPHNQPVSNGIGAFAHCEQAKVPLTPLPRKNRWINAFTIIPHAQPELLIVISNFNLNLGGGSLLEAR